MRKEAETKAMIEEYKGRIEELEANEEATRAALKDMSHVNAEGAAVKHPKFGDGTIREQDGNRVVVEFPGGEKKLSLRFLAEHDMLQDKDLADHWLNEEDKRISLEKMSNSLETDHEVLDDLLKS